MCPVGEGEDCEDVASDRGLSDDSEDDDVLDVSVALVVGGDDAVGGCGVGEDVGTLVGTANGEGNNCGVVSDDRVEEEDGDDDVGEVKVNVVAEGL